MPLPYDMPQTVHSMSHSTRSTLHTTPRATVLVSIETVSDPDAPYGRHVCFCAVSDSQGSHIAEDHLARQMAKYLTLCEEDCETKNEDELSQCIQTVQSEMERYEQMEPSVRFILTTAGALGGCVAGFGIPQDYNVVDLEDCAKCPWGAGEMVGSADETKLEEKEPGEEIDNMDMEGMGYALAEILQRPEDAMEVLDIDMGGLDLHELSSA